VRPGLEQSPLNGAAAAVAGHAVVLAVTVRRCSRVLVSVTAARPIIAGMVKIAMASPTERWVP
jgi:hypothetical protein